MQSSLLYAEIYFISKSSSHYSLNTCKIYNRRLLNFMFHTSSFIPIVLVNVFEFKRLAKLHNMELLPLDSSPIIVRLIKLVLID